MVQLSTLFFALAAAGSVTAAPAHLSKRIAQVIADSTPKWEAACVSKISSRSDEESAHHPIDIIRTPLEAALNAILSLSPPLTHFSLAQVLVISRTMPT